MPRFLLTEVYDPFKFISGRSGRANRRILKPKISNSSVGVKMRLGLRAPFSPSGLTSPLGLAARRVGGKTRFIELARFSTDVNIQALVRRWDSLSRSDKRYVSLDSLCLAGGVAPEELFGAVVAAAFRNGYDVSPMAAAVFNYLSVLEATIEGAQKESGFRKRRRLLAQARLLTSSTQG